MMIDINNPKQLLSHLFLDCTEVVDSVSKSAKWEEEGEIYCKVFFNDVELPAEVLERILQHFIDSIEKHYREHYNADVFDKEVESKANDLLKTQADDAVDKLYNLINVLQDYENLIKPYWERK